MSHKQILIVTPYSDFGEIVSQSLDKEASCDVKVATSNSEALTQGKKSGNLHYALLDMEMGVEKILELGFFLRNAFPPITLILISKRYPPTEMEDLRPWKYLHKPFVQKELLDLIHLGNYSTGKNPGFVDMGFSVGAAVPVSGWFTDEIRATKNLVAAMSNLDVQEAILVSNAEVLAHSGELPSEAVEECSRLAHKYWQDNSNTELIKPVRLETTQKQHLLSLTMVAVGIILALTFDAETPFEIMRSQARYLTKVLKNPQLALPDVHILPNHPDVPVVNKPAQLISPESTPDDHGQLQAAAEVTYPDLNVNEPMKHQEETGFRQENPSLDGYWDHGFREDDNPQPVVTIKENLPSWTNSTQSRDGRKNEQESIWIPANQTNEINPSKNTLTESKRGSLNPTHPGMFDVYYACLIVPRIRTHTLAGDCANFLRAELPNIFLAYGWRLEELIIDQNYLEWLVRIPPTIAPAAHIKLIRKVSSKLLLSNFSRFNRNEFLKDFWSPGYLLGGGRQLIPEAEIAEFIKLNRQQYYSEEDLTGTLLGKTWIINIVEAASACE